MERTGDPSLPEKARTLREQGLSWSQVATKLGIGRTTARRLCRSQPAADGGDTGRSSVGEDVPSEPPFQNGAQTVPSPARETATAAREASGTPSDMEEGGHLPETFRIFASLLRKAAQEGQKGG